MRSTSYSAWIGCALCALTGCDPAFGRQELRSRLAAWSDGRAGAAHAIVVGQPSVADAGFGDRSRAYYTNLGTGLGCRGVSAYMFDDGGKESEEDAAAALAREVQILADRSPSRPIRLFADGPRGHVVAHLAAAEAANAQIELVELQPETPDEQDKIEDAISTLLGLDDVPSPPERLPGQAQLTRRLKLSRKHAAELLQTVGFPELEPFVILEAALVSGERLLAPKGSAVALSRLSGAQVSDSSACSDPRLEPSDSLFLDGRPAAVDGDLSAVPCALGRVFPNGPDPLAVGELARSDARRVNDSVLAYYARNPFPRERDLRKQHVAEAHEILRTRRGIRSLLEQGDRAGAAGMLAYLLDTDAATATKLLDDLAAERPLDELAAMLPAESLYAWRMILTKPKKSAPPAIRPGPLPEDATMPISEMHLSGYRRPTEAAFTRDLLQVAMIEGFKVVLYAPKGTDSEKLEQQILLDSSLEGDGGRAAKHLEVRALDIGIEEFHAYAQDPQIAAWNAASRSFQLIGVPEVGPRALKVSERLIGTSLHYGVLSQVQGVASRFNGEADALSRASRPSGRARITSREARTYLEGGNVIAGTTKDGETYAIVGDDSAIISAMHFEETGAFSEPALAKKVAAAEKSGRFEASRDRFLAYERVLFPGEAKDELRTIRARRFFAEVEATKRVIAEDLGLPDRSVLFIEQGAFHIDMTMVPLRPGFIGVASYRAANELIERAIAHRDLRPGQWLQLSAMRRENERRGEALEPLLERLSVELHDRLGLTVVEIAAPISTGEPSTAHPCSKTERIDLNFVNAVPGLGRDGKAFYITSGTNIRALRDEFRKMMTQDPRLGIARVYYAGSGRPGPAFHSFAAESVMRGGGISCAQFHLPPRATRERSEAPDLHARSASL